MDSIAAIALDALRATAGVRAGGASGPVTVRVDATGGPGQRGGTRRGRAKGRDMAETASTNPTGDSPHREFWRDLKPIEQVFRPGALPEAYIADAPTEDERFYVPFSET